MPVVEARIKVQGKHFEISVDLDEALKVKAGKGDIVSALQSRNIFYDIKKGTIASQKDLQEAFLTSDVFEIAKQIITKGEVQKTQEFRDEEKENKIRISLIQEREKELAELKKKHQKDEEKRKMGTTSMTILI